MNEAAFGAVEWQFLPGLFAAGVESVLAKLGGGQTRLVLASITQIEGGDSGLADDIGAALEWLGKPAAGESRSLTGVFRLPGAGRASGRLESFGCGPSERCMLGLSVEVAREQPAGSIAAPAVTIKDWEIGLLGLACAALAGEDQGAVLLGNAFGRLGVGLGRGAVSEQLDGLLKVLGEQVEVLILAPGTAASLPRDQAFEISALGDLEERRRR